MWIFIIIDPPIFVSASRRFTTTTQKKKESKNEWLCTLVLLMCRHMQPTHRCSHTNTQQLTGCVCWVVWSALHASCLVPHASCPVSLPGMLSTEKASGFSLTLQLCAVARFCGSWLTAVPFQFSSVSRQLTTNKQLTVKTVCQQSDCRRLSSLSALCLFFSTSVCRVSPVRVLDFSGCCSSIQASDPTIRWLSFRYTLEAIQFKDLHSQLSSTFSLGIMIPSRSQPVNQIWTHNSLGAFILRSVRKCNKDNEMFCALLFLICRSV